MSRILLTGFQPFLGEKINPSEKIIEQVKAESRYLNNVETLLLPVTYAGAVQVLEKKVQSSSYDLILMLGQAGGRSKISLERVALNWMETSHPDESGVIPVPAMIKPDKPSAFYSKLPLREISDRLKDKNIPVEISFTAGAFVCNYIYFHMAERFQGQGSQCLFVHVPYLPEQVTHKTGVPSLELKTMKAGIFEILDFFI